MGNTENYIQILEESLEKKTGILEKIADYISIQKDMCKNEHFDIEEYNKIVEAKDKLASEIDTLDEGFSLVYDRVADILKADRQLYADDIRRLQESIARISDMITNIQAEEKRLFDSARGSIEIRRKEIGQVRKNNQMAANYYRSMSKTSSEPQFMDKKN